MTDPELYIQGIVELDARLKELKVRLEQLQLELIDLEQQLEEAKTQGKQEGDVTVWDEIESQRQAIESLENAIAAKRAEIQEVLDEIARIESDIAALEEVAEETARGADQGTRLTLSPQTILTAVLAIAALFGVAVGIRACYALQEASQEQSSDTGDGGEGDLGGGPGSPPQGGSGAGVSSVQGGETATCGDGSVGGSEACDPEACEDGNCTFFVGCGGTETCSASCECVPDGSIAGTTTSSGDLPTYAGPGVGCAASDPIGEGELVFDARSSSDPPWYHVKGDGWVFSGDLAGWDIGGDLDSLPVDDTAEACLTCGDGICSAELDESLASCPDDCPAVCGDGLCSAELDESAATCPADCAPVVACGDGFCSGEAGETVSTCPADCADTVTQTIAVFQCTCVDANNCQWYEAEGTYLVLDDGSLGFLEATITDGPFSGPWQGGCPQVATGGDGGGDGGDGGGGEIPE